MSLDKTLGRLSQRHLNRPGIQPQNPQSQKQAVRRGHKPQRKRQSIHFADQSVKDLDAAYDKADHDAYPRKFSKANFVEALITIGIQHVDEVVNLALQRQADEDDDEE